MRLYSHLCGSKVNFLGYKMFKGGNFTVGIAELGTDMEKYLVFLLQKQFLCSSVVLVSWWEDLAPFLSRSMLTQG